MAETVFKPLPPKEAVAYFRAKGAALAPSFAWQDVWQQEHATQFTVAKSAGFDILQDLHQAVDKAIAEGRTFADFKRDLVPTLQAKGWWGKADMVDPATGKVVTAQLGSPRRLRIIYDTNIRMAHAAGHWQQIQRVKEARPYLRYSAIMDGRTRPEHKGWHGLVLPEDDPFWDTHYPPNGWRCRCKVQQLGPRDLDRYGYQVSERPAPETRTWTNKRTGEVHQVPDGIDPGFAYHPGKAAPAAKVQELYVERLNTADRELAKAAIRRDIGAPAFESFLQGDVPGLYPVGILPPELQSLLRARRPVVALSQADAIKERARHPEATPAAWARVQQMLDQGEVIQETGKNQHLVFVLDEDGKPWYAVVKAAKDGSGLFLNSFRRTDQKNWEAARGRGKVIRPMGG